jgi:hypothetical protein
MPRDGGYPVRCGLSVHASPSLEYWIVRRSLSSGRPKGRTVGRGRGRGGASANSPPEEQTDRPPTPDPSPPRARARGGRGDHRAQLRDLAACLARGLTCSFRPLHSEGAGNAGRPMRPIAACAKVESKKHTRSQVTPESPGIPRAMVLRLMSSQRGWTGFC